jgi:hypothetical protein
MDEKDWLGQLERRIRSQDGRQVRVLTHGFSDEERNDRETERLLKSEEQMNAQDKVLSRLARIENRIRRMEAFNKYQMEHIHRYTRSAFNILAVVVVAVTVLGGIYLVNKELAEDLLTWLAAAAWVGYILFVFVREIWRGNEPASSDEWAFDREGGSSDAR